MFFGDHVMTYPLPSDVQELVDAQLMTGQYASEEEVLRDAMRALAEQQEDLTAIRDALEEWRSGDDGTPVAEVFDRLRHGASSEARE